MHDALIDRGLARLAGWSVFQTGGNDGIRMMNYSGVALSFAFVPRADSAATILADERRMAHKGEYAAAFGHAFQSRLSTTCRPVKSSQASLSGAQS